MMSKATDRKMVQSTYTCCLTFFGSQNTWLILNNQMENDVVTTSGRGLKGSCYGSRDHFSFHIVTFISLFNERACRVGLEFIHWKFIGFWKVGVPYHNNSVLDYYGDIFIRLKIILYNIFIFVFALSLSLIDLTTVASTFLPCVSAVCVKHLSVSIIFRQPGALCLACLTLWLPGLCLSIMPSIT